MKDKENFLSFPRSTSTSSLRAEAGMTQSSHVAMKKPSSLFSGVHTPEKSEEVVASYSHSLLAHTEEEEDAGVRNHGRPFFLKISQIRPGFYRFNTIVRVVSCSLSSFISLSSSSFFPLSSSADTSDFSSPSTKG